VHSGPANEVPVPCVSAVCKTVIASMVARVDVISSRDLESNTLVTSTDSAPTCSVMTEGFRAWTGPATFA